MRRACPNCGQTIPERRFGVRLSPLKARIVDTIARTRDGGIDADVLFWLIFSERTVPPSRLTLKSHVNQINDLLAGTDYRISGVRGGGRRFTLVSRKMKEAA